MTVATPLWRMHLVLSTHEPTGWASFEIEKSFFYCFIEIDSWVDLISLRGFGGLTMNRNRTICLLTGDGFCSDPPGENWEVGLMAPITEPLVELFWKLSDIIRSSIVHYTDCELPGILIFPFKLTSYLLHLIEWFQICLFTIISVNVVNVLTKAHLFPFLSAGKTFLFLSHRSLQDFHTWPALYHVAHIYNPDMACWCLQ